jgi:hypothetical protein
MGGRRVITPGATVAVLVLAGCGGGGGTRLLVHTTTTAQRTTTTVSAPPPSPAPPAPPAAPQPPTGPSPAAYVKELRAEEQTLARAERSIPTNATTPRALAHSTTLLARAVSQLAHGLASIKPPPAVAASHARLVAVVRTYAAQLRAAAALAGRPGGDVGAATQLVAATNRASAAFGATLSKIYSTLGVRQT